MHMREQAHVGPNEALQTFQSVLVCRRKLDKRAFQLSVAFDDLVPML